MTAATRPVRVLVALHSFEPGGVERDILRFVPAWRAAGMDARIALGRREGRLQEEAPDVPYFQMQTGGRSTANYETLWMIRKLPAVIREFEPDVLFLASNTLASVALGMRLKLGRKCPPIVFRVSNDLVRRDLSGIELRMHRLGLRIHANSHDVIVAMAPPVREEIVEQMRVDPAKVVVINNASMTIADVNRFAAARDTAPRDHKGRHFLGVGRLAPQKNFELMIEAFAKIARPEDRLTIVGEGTRRASITKRAQALGVADRLHLPGHLIGPENWFAEADAFIMSSDFEGVPAVIVEALAAGMPIVATDCATAIPSLIRGFGTLVPLGDAAALAAAMDGICNVKVDVPAMRARASEFTTEATTDTWGALFKRVAVEHAVDQSGSAAIAPAMRPSRRIDLV
ncbi:MAG: glycosyltransferase [Sphingomonadales bacterium]